MVIYDTVLVRYGELSTKGKNRSQFVARLLHNIKNALKDLEKLEYKSTYDRIYIYINGEDQEEIRARLTKVFGISSFSFTIKVESDIEVIKDKALEIIKDYPNKTFKVITRRNDKNFPLISDKVNREVAGHILRNTENKVDVHKYELPISIEIHKDMTYITTNKIEGAKGFPTGINGKVMLMISGGIDSPVAAYYIMKRGIEVEAVHFASPPYTSNNALEKVKQLCEIVSVYQGQLKLHTVNFTEIQMAIYASCNESYAITIMRRMMVRLAEKIAQNRSCLAIATGESLGQVASQTLESLSVINAAISIPVIRPLITFDKTEIIDKSKEIKTYETSILPYEDCCTIFTPKNPVTKPKLEKALKYESKFDYQSLLDKAIVNMESDQISKKKEIDSFL